MVSPRPVRAIAVTGGKGGVGKTNVSVNLAVAAADSGHKVMLLDGDLGLANIDVALGLHAEFNLSHVMRGERSLEEILVEGPAGIQVIPGASGVQHMAQLSTAEHNGLVSAFSHIGSSTDLLIVDTAAGISDTVVSFARAAHDIIVVVCDEPASMTDAYAIVKLLNRDYGHQNFHVLTNMVRTAQEGQQLFSKMRCVTDRYLDVTLHHMGNVPYDEALRKAVRSQRPVVAAYPRSRVAQAFKNLVKKVNGWPAHSGANGQVQFFLERLIQYASETRGAVL